MAKTETTAELLVVAMQDLNDGEHAVIDRLPFFENDISAGLSSYLSDERERAARQSARLEASLSALNASATDAPNIWLRAVLDDATRDYETIVPGPLRDIALVGAFRKGKQSERVSYETAVGLAKVTNDPDLATSLQICRDEEASADDELERLLQDLLGGI